MSRRKATSKKRDPRHCQIHPDANALDRTDIEKSRHVDKFHELVSVLRLSIMKSHGVEREIWHPNTPAAVREDMSGIFTIKTGLNADELDKKAKLRKLLTGNAHSSKHVADADHLFELYKYGGGYFITHDNRIHSMKEPIANLAQGVNVVTLAEFIQICSAFNPSNKL